MQAKHTPTLFPSNGVEKSFKFLVPVASKQLPQDATPNVHNKAVIGA